MNLPLPTDYARCLAHPRDYTARAAPNVWCEHLASCARHQTIKIDTHTGIVVPRLCHEHDKSFYIDVEAHGLNA